jgi:glycosyltransferase involved in cell wall biosynthesis
LRVLVLSHLYPHPDEPARGIFVHEQVAALRAAGVDARVLSGDALWLDPTRPAATLRRVVERLRAGPSRERETRDGVPVTRFRYVVLRGLWWRFGAQRYRAAALAAAAALRPGFAFELVHAHTALLDGFAGLAVARRWDAPLVLTEHSGPFRVLTRTRASRRCTAAAIAGADRGIAVSRALWRDIQAEVPVPHPERWRVLPNGVDAERFARAAAEGPARAVDRIEAIWIGHLLPIKRPLLLLDAFARAQREEPRLALTLVGDGPLAGAVRERARSLGLGTAFALQPAADRAGVAAHLARSDFLVLASERETFGVVVIEALAAGRPVLSTRCGGPEELLTDERLGLLVDGDEASLARGLVRLARRIAEATPEEARERREWIRAYATERYGYAALAPQLRALYRDALGSVAVGRALTSPS